MANKVFLDQEGLERLVEYINNSLNNKADIGDVPADVVKQADLANYALKSEIPEGADLSGYATKEELEDYASADDLSDLRAEVTSLYHFKGSVENLTALRAIENPHEGDVYNLNDSGINAAWVLDDEGNGHWDEFGGPVDLSDYWTETELQAMSIPLVDSILFGGKSAVVSDISGLNAMISNDEAEVEIKLNKDMTLGSNATIEIPEGKKVVLDLGGNDITAAGTAFSVTGGELVVKDGAITSSTNTTISATEGAIVTIDGADITSSRFHGISATESDVIINSGSVTSQEAGVAGFKDSTITINGGVITGIDNGPIMGNGSPAGSTNDGTNCNIVMNGGTLVAHIQSAGYIACGVYVPNSGSFTMNGGEIISDGCGICMRGGQVNLNGGSIVANGASGVTGKVGDSRVVVGPYAVVYDAQSKYPAVDSLELNIAKGMNLQGTDGDIQIVESSYVANINDHRND